MRSAATRVAVIGGGWAGLAAAVRLTEEGIACTVFEAANALGGRARRVDWKTGDGRTIALDNGQHILIGAYRRTLALLQHVGIDLDLAFERTPLRLISASGFALRASHQRAPWHMVSALLTARRMTLAERWAVVRLMTRARRIAWTLPEDRSVASMLDAWKQPASLVRKLWAPLCVAALNTPIEGASAQVFLNVLRDSLGADARDSDLLLPKTDLGALLPDATGTYLDHAAARGSIERGVRIQNLLVEEQGVSIAAGTATEVESAQRFDAAVIAVPPYEAARLLAPMALRDARYRPVIEQCEAFAFQPIVTAWFQYRDPPQWPARMMALDESAPMQHYGQWVFDRSERLVDGVRDASPARGLVACVISAEGAHRDMDRSTLLTALADQLARQCGLPSQPLASQVITEKRATFACAPALARPGSALPHARIALAGDYVSDGDRTTHYPATLEAAVLAGAAAAERLLHGIGDR